MQIEIVTPRLRSQDPETGVHYALAKGDRVTVSDTAGAYWASIGWVKAVDSIIETGPQSVAPARLQVQSSQHQLASVIKGEK